MTPSIRKHIESQMVKQSELADKISKRTTKLTYSELDVMRKYLFNYMKRRGIKSHTMLNPKTKLNMTFWAMEHECRDCRGKIPAYVHKIGMLCFESAEIETQMDRYEQFKRRKKELVRNR